MSVKAVQVNEITGRISVTVSDGHRMHLRLDSERRVLR